MKIDIKYVSPTYYDRTNIKQWALYFRKYRDIIGFNIRIFGVNINIRENNATQKLIEKHMRSTYH